MFRRRRPSSWRTLALKDWTEGELLSCRESLHEQAASGFASAKMIEEAEMEVREIDRELERRRSQA